MALGAVLAAALTTHGSRNKGLFVGGVDVMAEPATPSRYSVPIETVSLTEMGPDGVSSMDFTIECSTALPITVTEGMEVRFEDFANPTLAEGVEFRGWVDHVDYEDMPGNIGTRFKVRCTGAEAALDWAVLPNDVVIPTGTLPETAILALAGQAVGPVMSFLRAFASTTGSSTGDGPIANGFPAMSNGVTVSAGTTLREGIRQVLAQVPVPLVATGLPVTAFDIPYTTVDFYGGLRMFAFGFVVNAQNIGIDDDPPLTLQQAGDLQYGVDAAQTRGVVVKGTGVTVTVMDGSGKAGAMAVLSDSTITTTAAATSAGLAYLSQYGASARGSYTLDATAVTFNPRVYVYRTFTQITDARVGLSTTNFLVMAIAKQFLPGNLENWTVSFGGRPPSLTALTRQLTRTQLS